jgi:molybdopterin-biosynthesis enzyme MoeA-like protein
MAVGVEVEYLPELWDQIQERFRRFGRQPTDNNKRQAYIPAGAIFPLRTRLEPHLPSLSWDQTIKP